MNNDNDLIRVSGLWLSDHPDASGKKFMSGSHGSIVWFVFRNQKKVEGSSQPDYYLCIARNAARQQAAQQADLDAFAPPPDVNDIPF